MKTGAILSAFFLLIFFTLAGCKPQATKVEGPRPLAKVNGVPVTAEDVLLRLGGHGEYMATPLRDQALNDVINEELLYQKGVELGLDKDERFQRTARMMERRAVAYKRGEMSRRVRDTQVAAKVNVTDEDLRAYYDEHAEQIATDLKLGVLEFLDEGEAKEALDKIRGGTAFEQVAAGKFSQAPRGKSPWDKGFLHWNEIPVYLLDAVYGLKKGEVSDVIRAGKSGIYIVKVIDRRRNNNASFENMRAIVTNRLNSARIAEAYDRYIERLKKEAEIKMTSDAEKPVR